MKCGPGAGRVSRRIRRFTLAFLAQQLDQPDLCVAGQDNDIGIRPGQKKGRQALGRAVVNRKRVRPLRVPVRRQPPSGGLRGRTDRFLRKTEGLLRRHWIKGHISLKILNLPFAAVIIADHFGGVAAPGAVNTDDLTALAGRSFLKGRAADKCMRLVLCKRGLADFSVDVAV